jgi:hypothetical protein
MSNQPIDPAIMDPQQWEAHCKTLRAAEEERRRVSKTLGSTGVTPYFSLNVRF